MIKEPGVATTPTYEFLLRISREFKHSHQTVALPWLRDAPVFQHFLSPNLLEARLQHQYHSSQVTSLWRLLQTMEGDGWQLDAI